MYNPIRAVVNSNSEKEILRQKRRFELLRERLGESDVEKVKQALTEREAIEPESDLGLRTIEKLRSKLKTFQTE